MTYGCPGVRAGTLTPIRSGDALARSLDPRPRAPRRERRSFSPISHDLFGLKRKWG